MKFGLLGFPLTHSFSPDYFNSFFAKLNLNDHTYCSLPIPNEQNLIQFFQNEATKYKGLNVTIPYKQTVIPFMHQMDAVAEEIGAVNVIHISSEGVLMGHNTDGPAFLETLKMENWNWEHKTAIVLGNGGSSKAIQWALSQLKMKIYVVSRTPADKQLNWEQLDSDLCLSSSLVVNTTPIGMYPGSEVVPPFPRRGFHQDMLVYDLIYNPDPTRFLSEAKSAGAHIISGNAMLIKQAELSWDIWQQ